MTWSFNPSPQSIRVTSSGVKVGGVIRNCKVEVNQVVWKNASVVNQSRVRSVDTEALVSYPFIMLDAIRVKGNVNR